MPLTKNKYALILLGASDFKDSFKMPPDEAMKMTSAFLAAKDRILSLFKQTYECELKEDFLLDLFDSPISPSEIDVNVTKFITEKLEQGITDLIVYYIGHGVVPNDEFLLLTKSSRIESPEISSIIFRFFANTIVRNASAIRNYIILDCCFAAMAAKEFPAVNSNRTNGSDNHEEYANGVSLYCSSSDGVQSRVVPSRNITMFTESFAQALDQGSARHSGSYLSLNDIDELTQEMIDKLNKDKEDRVYPEIHSPKLYRGKSIAEAPLFPNYYYVKNKFGKKFSEKIDFDGRIRSWRKEICRDSNIKWAIDEYLDLILDMDKSGKNFFIEEDMKNAAAYHNLVDNKMSIPNETYLERKIELNTKMNSRINIVYAGFIKYMQECQ